MGKLDQLAKPAVARPLGKQARVPQLPRSEHVPYVPRVPPQESIASAEVATLPKNAVNAKELSTLPEAEAVRQILEAEAATTVAFDKQDCHGQEADQGARLPRGALAAALVGALS